MRQQVLQDLEAGVGISGSHGLGVYETLHLSHVLMGSLGLFSWVQCGVAVLRFGFVMGCTPNCVIVLASLLQAIPLWSQHLVIRLEFSSQMTWLWQSVGDVHLRSQETFESCVS